MRDTVLHLHERVPAEPRSGPLTLESVYRRHFKAVWRLLRRLGVGVPQLDDAAQDVFLVVQRKLGEFEPDTAAQTWVFAIAVRVASEYRRRAARARADEYHDTIPDAAPSPARLSEVQESVRLLHEILSEFDEKKRSVFVLSELEQLSAPDIARVLDVNINTVYSRLRAAKKQFDAALLRRRAASRVRTRT